LIELARARSSAQAAREHVTDYRQLATMFMRLTDLDSRSLGPELAKLQDLSRTVPAQPLGIRGKIRGVFFKAVNPVLGRFLRAASLASPYRAAYEMAVDLLTRQLESESRMRAEIASLKDRIENLEAKAELRKTST
jgi:hypothetical protein